MKIYMIQDELSMKTDIVNRDTFENVRKLCFKNELPYVLKNNGIGQELVILKTKKGKN